MVMKICPKWKMDSAAELAVKNWCVQKKSKNDPLTWSRYLVGPVSRRRDALRIKLGDALMNLIFQPKREVCPETGSISSILGDHGAEFHLSEF